MGVDHEAKGDLEPVPDRLAYGLIAAEGDPPVEGHQVLDEVSVLHDHRVAQVNLVENGIALFLGECPLAGGGDDALLGIGDGPEGQGHHEGDDEDDDEKLKQLLTEVSHVVSFVVP